MEAPLWPLYRKDVESNANIDLTSIAISKKIEEGNLTLSEETKKVWHEAKSDDGGIYYWNIITNDTSWTVPEGGYLSLKEQREDKDKETAKQLKELDKVKRKEGLLRMQMQKQEDEEERARLVREKLKERRVADDIPEPVYGPILEPGKK
ncbi:hypothetical protein NQ317_000885 [Molorchus minor]|uniref:WW domain-containing protein n=1 Tax=Molorchus minor TaxID=1323400 RepID=A0ABQ9JUS5_9CUCU|nr:hypothetical protein NQ317_000885 [Molorchus minor]